MHVATTAVGAVAVGAALLGRRRLALRGAATWLGATAELASERIAPGPRTPSEIATMLATSAVLPAAATFWWIVGLVRWRTVHRAKRPSAVLLDRDGTLVENVPYNGDPERVVPMPGAREALERLRSAGVPTAVVSNQSGIGRGLLTPQQVDAVNSRVEELLGPLGPWVVCPHDPSDACACRKPEPGLVIEAARSLGVDPRRCALVGDIGADVEAARRAGARPILVPNPATRAEEVESAAEVARDLPSAVELLIGEHR
jgi:histidinol-phosphate phosphatase family protein